MKALGAENGDQNQCSRGILFLSMSFFEFAFVLSFCSFLEDDVVFCFFRVRRIVSELSISFFFFFLLFWTMMQSVLLLFVILDDDVDGLVVRLDLFVLDEDCLINILVVISNISFLMSSYVLSLVTCN